MGYSPWVAKSWTRLSTHVCTYRPLHKNLIVAKMQTTENHKGEKNVLRFDKNGCEGSGNFILLSIVLYKYEIFYMEIHL